MSNIRFIGSQIKYFVHYFKWRRVILKLNLSKVLEIGGPSRVFILGIPIYINAQSLTFLNYSENTIWDKKSYLESLTLRKLLKKIITKNIVLDAANICHVNKKYSTIIASHVLEHIANPLKFILNTRLILEEKGRLLFIVPRPEKCFDKYRNITEFSHILNDHDLDIDESDITHRDDFLRSCEKYFKKEDLQEIITLAQNNVETRIIHHHCYDLRLLTETFLHCDYKIIIAKQTPTELLILGEKHGK